MRHRTIIWLSLSAAAVVAPSAALAQLSFPGSANTTMSSGSTIRHDVAYDPANNVSLLVATTCCDQQLRFRFVDGLGNPLGFTRTARAHGSDSAVMTYSPHVANGADGSGGFLLLWTDLESSGGVTSATIYAQLISFEAGLVGPERTVAVITPARSHSIQLSVAYSPVSHQFLTAWTTCCSAPSARFVRLDLNGSTVGASAPVASGPPSADVNDEFSFENNNVEAVWNPVSGEFGVVYQDARAALPFNKLVLAFARIQIDGTVAGRTLFQDAPTQDYWAAVGVNPVQGNYVIAWKDGVGASGMPSGVTSIAADGTVLGQQLFGNVAAAGYIDLAFSTTTGTFLVTMRNGVREVGADGDPLTEGWLPFPEDQWTFPQVTALSGGDWLIAAPQLARLVRSATRNGGCSTPDPFVFFGGGTCHNGGWLPPGMMPPPPPVFGGCLTPDPFVALGGGTCYNGGWLPPGMLTASPTEVADLACATPDPFASIAGMAGLCVDGGWIPTSVITIDGTLRLVAAGKWAIESEGRLLLLAIEPPNALQVDGLRVSVSAKVRTDLAAPSGYSQVVEIVSLPE